MYVKKYPGAADSISKLLQGFQGPFKVKTFKFHEASNSHKKCCDIDLARYHPENTPLDACQRKMVSKMFEHLKCLFNTTYYIAKFNKPLTDFKNLIALLNNPDVDTGSRPSSRRVPK
jgi:hypothetical protein